MENDPVLFSLPEAAAQTGYNDQYLRELCRSHRIPFILRRGRYFFTAQDIRAILQGTRFDPSPSAPAAPAAPKIEKGGKGNKGKGK